MPLSERLALAYARRSDSGGGLGYNVDQFGGTRISDQGRQNSFIAAVSASA